MARFLVERYVPGATTDTFANMVATIQSHIDKTGSDTVRYLGSIVVPGDDACLCLFEAGSTEAVEELNRAIGTPVDRVVRVLSLDRGTTSTIATP